MYVNHATAAKAKNVCVTLLAISLQAITMKIL